MYISLREISSKNVTTALLDNMLRQLRIIISIQYNENHINQQMTGLA
jgi:hypothetical protein